MSANILTVDDSASIRLTTKVTLTNAGYTVTEAVNGAEGLATAKSTHFLSGKARVTTSPSSRVRWCPAIARPSTCCSARLREAPARTRWASS